MPDYMNASLDVLAKDIIDDGIVDADEVEGLRKRIYADGVVDREEADFLFLVNDAVSGNNNDLGWKDLFVDALTKYVLDDEVSPGVVDEDEAEYLISKIEADGTVDEIELALFVNIMATAKSTAEKLQEFVLASIKSAILEDGIIDAQEVEMLKKVIYGSGGGAGEGVDRAEAEFLFNLNDAVSGKANAPAWKEFFVEALTKHVLDDETSPGELDDGEAEYLMQKIEADGQVDEIENALIKNIRNVATAVSEKLTL
jgi:hypothetical protein